jgi:hypothetical protein
MTPEQRKKMVQIGKIVAPELFGDIPEDPEEKE